MAYEIISALITAIPATIVAGIALAISRNQVRLGKQQAHLANQTAQLKLFARFNERFDIMNEDLNAILAGVDMPSSTKTKEAVAQDYLNLCSEEYLWHQKGLIDSQIWNAWLDGIRHYLNQESIISNVFIREKKASPDSYYGVFELLNNLPS